MAQPWTESAPVDFGKFGQAAAAGAIEAQKQFAETSKSFSDLLTKNIDDVNRAKNTLQATELLNSLDVDSSKQLLKSGNLMGSIAGLLNTDNIDFKNEDLNKAITDAQTRIVNNDEAIFKDYLTTPGNENDLLEDPNTLKSKHNLVLSTSKIIELQNAGKSKFTNDALFKEGMDPLNSGKSPSAIKYKMLNKYGNLIKLDELKDDAIHQALETGRNTNTSMAINATNNYLANIAANKRKADGLPEFIASRDMVNDTESLLISMGKYDEAKNLRNNLDAAVTLGLRKGNSSALYSIESSYLMEEGKALQAGINSINERSGDAAKHVMGGIFKASIEKGNLSIQDYVKTLSTKEANLFMTVYEQIKDHYGLSPAEFHAALTGSGIFLQNYEKPLDLIKAIDASKPLKNIESNKQIIPSAIVAAKNHYKNIIAELEEKKLDAKIEAYNSGTNSIATALDTSTSNTTTPTNTAGNITQQQAQDAWGNQPEQLSNLETILDKPINDTSRVNNFDILSTYGESPSTAYIDNPLADAAAILVGGIGGGVLGKAVGKTWGKSLLGSLFGTGIGFSGKKGFESYFLTNSDYMLDDKLILEKLSQIDKRMLNGKPTTEDIAFLENLRAGGASLSNPVKQKLGEILSTPNKIKRVLNSTSK